MNGNESKAAPEIGTWVIGYIKSLYSVNYMERRRKEKKVHISGW